MPHFPQARRALNRALETAGINDPRTQLHGIEVHDCFSVSEVIAYEVIGLADPGEGASTFLHNGATMQPTTSARKSLGPMRPRRPSRSPSTPAVA